ncbi:MAG: PrsW family intramembrane metalloprotease [Candidatus Eisenbacteria bacterium]|uniref:PrsW family intramembrane metalloprotease n=1 Tax=Eiseniibacteriota bacterium TaxID=2212470 RepID=A0A7Y2H2Q9_UNCEI|nr:PrsW family intramembrane metalloprotease [Candidatus Eisenbacteria bacterium]
MIPILISALAAIIPATLYAMFFYWMDRYEHEPGWLLRLTFLWGAIPAIFISIVGEVLLSYPLSDTVRSIQGDLYEAALVAPVVEETAKALALLWVYKRHAREFDGPLDGLIYGAMIGFGFSMTEDFAYFVSAYEEGGYAEQGFTIFARAVLFGLSHAFFTGITGISFGFARIHRNRSARRLYPVLGLALSITFHMLHNFGAVLASVNTAAIFVTLWVATVGVLSTIVIVVWFWKREQKVIHAYLEPEIGTLITEAEYQKLRHGWRKPAAFCRGDEKNLAFRLQTCMQFALRKNRFEHGEADLVDDVAELHQSLKDSYLA